MAPNTITVLSDEIAENTKIITEYLESKGLAAASFDVDGLAEYPIPPSDDEPFKARLKLIDLTKQLHDLALGPKESLRFLAWDSVNTLSLLAVYQFKVASAIKIDEEVTFAELSKRVNVDETNLKRLVRHAMTNHIFHEPRKGYVAHTRVSRLLAEDEQMAGWVGLLNDDCWLPMAHTLDAMRKWPGSQEPNETGMQIAYNTTDPFFKIMASSPERLRRHGKAMAAHSAGEGFGIAPVIEGYPWSELGEGTVVDLGGSQGHVSIAIAEKFPKLKFVVQDLPTMRTPEVLDKIPDGLQSRVSLTTHDFFQTQPVVGADVYFFRHIFHNWPDLYCIKILRALIPALKPGARVLLNDGIAPEPGTMGVFEDKLIRTLDLFMLVTVNAREREIDDWEALFKEADPRFKFLRAYLPPKSRLWLIEAEWNPDGDSTNAKPSIVA